MMHLLPSSSDRAAEWFALMRSGDLQAAQMLEFEEWRAASPRNDHEFEKLTRSWNDLDVLQVEPEILALREWARETDPERSFKPFAWGALAASLAVALLTSGWFLHSQLYGAAHVGNPTEYSTQIGQRANALLADGSNVSLDTNSAVRVQLTDTERRIELVRGRAFFKVAKNPSRPFIVSAGNLHVTAIGTQFDVDLRPASTSVSLAEGRINVKDQVIGRDHPLSLNMNAGYRVTASGTGLVVNKVDPDLVAGWRSGKLIFNNATLGDIAGELARYSERPIRVDAALSSQRMSAVLPSDRPSAFIASAQTLGLGRGHITPDAFILSAR